MFEQLKLERNWISNDDSLFEGCGRFRPDDNSVDYLHITNSLDDLNLAKICNTFSPTDPVPDMSYSILTVPKVLILNYGQRSYLDLLVTKKFSSEIEKIGFKQIDLANSSDKTVFEKLEDLITSVWKANGQHIVYDLSFMLYNPKILTSKAQFKYSQSINSISMGKEDKYGLGIWSQSACVGIVQNKK